MTCVQVQGGHSAQLRWRPPPALPATAAPIKRQFGGRARCARPRAVRGAAVRGQPGRGSSGDKTCAHLPGHRQLPPSGHDWTVARSQPGPCHHQPRCSRSRGLKASIPFIFTSSHICSLLSRRKNVRPQQARTLATLAAAIVTKLSIQVSKRLSVICYRFLGSLRLSNANI